jgi:hypothetical protein
MTDDFDHTPATENTPDSAINGLWLTPGLTTQFIRNARIGVPLMVLWAVVGVASVVIDVYDGWETWWNKSLSNFYLLEGKNLSLTISLLLSLALYYCFARAIIFGFKAWQLLRRSESDDDALLQGTSLLPQMFRWLSFWGILSAISLALPLLSN